jgi:regulator of sigma E protease
MDHSPVLAVKNGVISTGQMTVTMFKSLKMIFTGKVGMNDLQGPVGIVSLVHQSESYGLYYFFYLLAFISINLAIINMLPLPALDGGRIIFVIIRAITGKVITDKMEGNVHAAGMLLLLALMLFVTWNDIVRLFK